MTQDGMGAGLTNSVSSVTEYFNNFKINLTIGYNHYNYVKLC